LLGWMHSWKDGPVLEWSIGPITLGFQADMAHTLLYLPVQRAGRCSRSEDVDWKSDDFEQAYRKLALPSPWTIDLHIAQNDATVKGSALMTRQAGIVCRAIPG